MKISYVNNNFLSKQLFPVSYDAMLQIERKHILHSTEENTFCTQREHNYSLEIETQAQARRGFRRGKRDLV